MADPAVEIETVTEIYQEFALEEICLPETQSKDPIKPTPIKDAANNRIEVYCIGGNYKVKFVRADGTVAWIGECRYPRGHNRFRVKMKVKVKVSLTFNPEGWMAPPKPVGPAEPLEILVSTWKNIDAQGLPPTTGKEGPEASGPDLLWIYDPKNNKLTTQKTKQKGKWVLKPAATPDKPTAPDKPTNWMWVVSEETNDGEPSTANAPDDPDSLPPLKTERSGMSFPAPTDWYYCLYTPVPFTVFLPPRGEVFTATARRAASATQLELSEITATAGREFEFEIVVPYKEDNVVRFRLAEGPAGMTMDRMGVIRWTPSASQIGNHRVVVEHRFVGLTPHRDEFVLPVRAAPSRRSSRPSPAKPRAQSRRKRG